jgi:hypothetical protein
MNFRERPKKNDSPETTISHQADLALNQVAFQHAEMLESGRSKITELQILILRDVCQ